MKDNIFTNDDVVVIVSYSAKYHISLVLSVHYSEVSVTSGLDEILFSAPSLSCIMFCQGAQPLCRSSYSISVRLQNSVLSMI